MYETCCTKEAIEKEENQYSLRGFLNFLNTSFGTVLVLMVWFTLKVLNRIHAQDFLSSATSLCLRVVTEDCIWCAKVAYEVFKCPRNVFSDYMGYTAVGMLLHSQKSWSIVVPPCPIIPSSSAGVPKKNVSVATISFR
jgi:hypothetical protein